MKEIYVSLYSYDNNYGQKDVGILHLHKDGTVKWLYLADKDLEHIIKDKVFDTKSKKYIRAEENPERWLKSMCKQYKSPYLWASQPIISKGVR